MLKISLHIAARTLQLLRRAALALTLLVGFIMAGVILTLRYSVLPDIEQYHSDITLGVGKAIGLEIEIGKIEADWHGLGPHLRLSEIHILDKQKRTTLALQRVDVVVSWMTLLAGELRLSSLEIDQPDLLVKRNKQGKLQISGVQVEDTASDNNVANLLLNQSRIAVRGAHISWLDEVQGTPLLIFDNVNLLIENGWNHHRFALRAVPPKALSTQLDVRGNLFGKNFDDLTSWRGEIFTELEYADLAAWKTWLPIPDTLKQGNGALRGWLRLEDGKISSVTTDLALLNVQTRLASDLSPLDIRVLSGRMAWHDTAPGFEISTRNFALKLYNDFVLKPTDLVVSLSNVQDLEASSGEIRANLLELDGLSKLMEYLPLDKQFKARYASFSPQGMVENLQVKWQVETGKKTRYQVSGRFADLALQQVDTLPGFSGLSGEIEGSERSGTLSIKSRNLKLDAPQIMPVPLAFDTLTAQSIWTANPAGFEVKLRNVVVANPDLVGTAYGSYQTLNKSPGKLDLTVHLTRVSVAHAVRYIPLIALNTETRSWLGQSLLDGLSSDFNLRIKGDLNDFPFVDNKKGIFKIQARASDVALEYVPGWPRVEHANANLLMQGKSLEINALSAITNDVRLSKINVAIPDLLLDKPVMTIRGEAEGENTRALAFIAASPVRGYIDGFTDDIVARGTGKLNLKLEIPLSSPYTVKLAGNYHFKDSEIEFDQPIPTLRKVNGDLLFNESGISSKNIVAQILGGPAKFFVETNDDGAINIKVGGKANFDTFTELNSLPIFTKLHGEPVWNLDIGVKNKQSNILITSNLQALESVLPAPLDKPVDFSLPLRVEIKGSSPDKRVIAVQLGTRFNATILQSKDEDNVWNIKRGSINFGTALPKSERDGLWLTGAVPLLSAEGWGVLVDALEGGDNQSIGIAGADLSIQKVSGYGYAINDLRIKANSRGDILTAQLSSKEINGEVSWQSINNGWLIAKLKNLDLAETEQASSKPVQPESAAQAKPVQVVDLPSVDLSIEKLSFKGRQLGKLELLAKQHDETYQIDHLRLVNPDGVLTVDGKWLMSDKAPQTQINLKLEISNAGNILARSGYPNTLKNGSGKLDGVFNWPGSPGMVSSNKLSGKLTLDTGKGQFLQVDPGIGKLLSILSLQALPKRISLDFEDVFSKGFEFDNISGSADIKEGVIATNNLKIEGSSAKVFMTGQMDTVNETQNMRVRIVPAVGNSVALITALVASNPLIMGPAIFLTNQVFNDPLGQLVSFEYNISGSWADPKVEKVGEKKPSK